MRGRASNNVTENLYGKRWDVFHLGGFLVILGLWLMRYPLLFIGQRGAPQISYTPSYRWSQREFLISYLRNHFNFTEKMLEIKGTPTKL